MATPTTVMNRLALIEEMSGYLARKKIGKTRTHDKVHIVGAMQAYLSFDEPSDEGFQAIFQQFCQSKTPVAEIFSTSREITAWFSQIKAELTDPKHIAMANIIENAKSAHHEGRSRLFDYINSGVINLAERADLETSLEADDWAFYAPIKANQDQISKIYYNLRTIIAKNAPNAEDAAEIAEAKAVRCAIADCMMRVMDKRPDPTTGELITQENYEGIVAGILAGKNKTALTRSAEATGTSGLSLDKIERVLRTKDLSFSQVLTEAPTVKMKYQTAFYSQERYGEYRSSSATTVRGVNVITLEGNKSYMDDLNSKIAEAKKAENRPLADTYMALREVMRGNLSWIEFYDIAHANNCLSKVEDKVDEGKALIGHVSGILVKRAVDAARAVGYDEAAAVADEVARQEALITIAALGVKDSPAVSVFEDMIYAGKSFDAATLHQLKSLFELEIKSGFMDHKLPAIKALIQPYIKQAELLDTIRAKAEKLETHLREDPREDKARLVDAVMVFLEAPTNENLDSAIAAGEQLRKSGWRLGKGKAGELKNLVKSIDRGFAIPKAWDQALTDDTQAFLASGTTDHMMGVAKVKSAITKIAKVLVDMDRKVAKGSASVTDEGMLHIGRALMGYIEGSKSWIAVQKTISAYPTVLKARRAKHNIKSIIDTVKKAKPLTIRDHALSELFIYQHIPEVAAVIERFDANAIAHRAQTGALFSEDMMAELTAAATELGSVKESGVVDAQKAIDAVAEIEAALVAHQAVTSKLQALCETVVGDHALNSNEEHIQTVAQAALAYMNMPTEASKMALEDTLNRFYKYKKNKQLTEILAEVLALELSVMQNEVDKADELVDATSVVTLSEKTQDHLAEMARLRMMEEETRASRSSTRVSSVYSAESIDSALQQLTESLSITAEQVSAIVGQLSDRTDATVEQVARAILLSGTNEQTGDFSEVEAMAAIRRMEDAAGIRSHLLAPIDEDEQESVVDSSTGSLRASLRDDTSEVESVIQVTAQVPEASVVIPEVAEDVVDDAAGHIPEVAKLAETLGKTYEATYAIVEQIYATGRAGERTPTSLAKLVNMLSGGNKDTAILRLQGLQDQYAVDAPIAIDEAGSVIVTEPVAVVDVAEDVVDEAAGHIPEVVTLSETLGKTYEATYAIVEQIYATGRAGDRTPTSLAKLVNMLSGGNKDTAILRLQGLQAQYAVDAPIAIDEAGSVVVTEPVAVADDRSSQIVPPPPPPMATVTRDVSHEAPSNRMAGVFAAIRGLNTGDRPSTDEIDARLSRSKASATAPSTGRGNRMAGVFAEIGRVSTRGRRTAEEMDEQIKQRKVPQSSNPLIAALQRRRAFMHPADESDSDSVSTASSWAGSSHK